MFISLNLRKKNLNEKNIEQTFNFKMKNNRLQERHLPAIILK